MSFILRVAPIVDWVLIETGVSEKKAPGKRRLCTLRTGSRVVCGTPIQVQNSRNPLRYGDITVPIVKRANARGPFVKYHKTKPTEIGRTD